MPRFILFAVCTVVLRAALAMADAPFVDMSYDEACRAAKDGNKPVLVCLTVEWSAPCRLLEMTTFQDADVAKEMKSRTIPVKVDADTESFVVKKLDVTRLPAVLIVSPAGAIVDRIVGYREPEEFRESLMAILAGKTGVEATPEKQDGATDPIARLRNAMGHASRGHHGEALRDFLWCYDRGIEFDQAFDCVRLTMLDDVAELARVYPPALRALRVRRDAAEQAVLACARRFKERGEGERPKRRRRGEDPVTNIEDVAGEQTLDLARLNACLQEKERTLSVFRACLGDNDNLSQMRNVIAEDVISIYLERRDYKAIRQNMNDYLEEAGRRIDITLGAARLIQGQMQQAAMDSVRQAVVADAASAYEALVGLGERRRADVLAGKLISAAEFGDSYSALIEAALRAGDASAARDLADRAKRSLNKDEFEKVKEAAAAIPPVG